MWVVSGVWIGIDFWFVILVVVGVGVGGCGCYFGVEVHGWICYCWILYWIEIHKYRIQTVTISLLILQIK